MKRTLTLVAVAITLGLDGWVVTPLTPSAVAESVVAEATAENQTLTFAIEKMTCALCPVTVHKAIERVEGVDSVKVNFEKKTATVAFDPSKTALQKIVEASTNAGYPAHQIEG